LSARDPLRISIKATSSMLSMMCWPSPLRSRRSSAVVTAKAALAPEA